MTNYFPVEGETTKVKRNLLSVLKDLFTRAANTAAIPVLNLTHTPRKIDPHYINVPKEEPKDYPVKLPR